MSELTERARIYATRCHEAVGHVRKYTGENYINHPAGVVDLVLSIPHIEAMVCAAWLHDTVEDTHATLWGIEQMFGIEIASLVEMLTDVSNLEDGNRAIRKAIDREHTAKASPEAKTIKLADLIDNSRTIAEHDADFAKVYMAEKALLLEVLRDGDESLWNMANSIICKYYNRK